MTRLAPALAISVFAALAAAPAFAGALDAIDAPKARTVVTDPTVTNSVVIRDADKAATAIIRTDATRGAEAPSRYPSAPVSPAFGY